MNGSLTSVQLLLQTNANIQWRSPTSGQSLLAKLCLSLAKPTTSPETELANDDFLAIAKLLIDRGVPHQATDKRGRTSLHLLAASKLRSALAVAELLLAYGLSVNALDGMPP